MGPFLSQLVYSLSLAIMDYETWICRSIKWQQRKEMEYFEPYGKIERVKKIKDYGFVHFEERENAVKAMEALNGTVSISEIYLR